MTMQWIRDNYGVPAKRGGRVRLGKGFSEMLQGRVATIASADYHLTAYVDTPVGRMRIRLHPTWELEYLPEADS